MIDRFELKQILEKSVAIVVFTKVNGEQREMKCTLLAEYVPKQNVVEKQLLSETLTPKENPSTMAVWDVENNGWRSFRLDSINSVSASSI
jgi:hypothetical protein